MCIVYLKCAKEGSFFLVFVRDERAERVAAPLARLPGRPHLLAGIDPLRHGTWLAINTDLGVVVGLTNKKDEKQRQGLSRGQLVLRLAEQIDSEAKALELLRLTSREWQKYQPFNLFVVMLSSSRSFYLEGMSDKVVQLDSAVPHVITNFSSAKDLHRKTKLIKLCEESELDVVQRMSKDEDEDLASRLLIPVTGGKGSLSATVVRGSAGAYTAREYQLFPERGVVQLSW